MENIISMKNVTKYFKENRALKNLTFSIEEGEIFGFLGPSGAGKTTTIKLLTSQLIPTSGEIKIFGKNVYSNKREIVKNIGILSDTSGMYERLSVLDNLMLFANINDVPKENILEILDRIGMKETAKKEVKKLSKGMKQRLMIVRAVLHKPKLVFLDEPTSSLDPGTTLEIHKLLRKLNDEGTTIFLTTHNMFEADKLCDRVAFLNDGEIVDIGDPQALKLKYTNDDIKIILKDGSKEIMVKNNPEGALKIKGWMEKGQLIAIHSMEPSLEKYFRPYREGTIMDFSIRRVNALLKKEIKDFVKNMNVWVMCFLPVMFSIIYSKLLGNNSSSAPMNKVSVLILCVGMNIALISSMVISMLIAEEKEKNTLRTLMLSAVSPWEFLAGKVLITFLVSEVVNIVIFFFIGCDIQYLGQYILITTLVLFSMIEIGAIIGIISPNQMTTGVFSMPVITIFL